MIPINEHFVVSTYQMFGVKTIYTIKIATMHFSIFRIYSQEIKRRQKVNRIIVTFCNFSTVWRHVCVWEYVCAWSRGLACRSMCALVSVSACVCMHTVCDWETSKIFLRFPDVKLSNKIQKQLKHVGCVRKTNTALKLRSITRLD